MKTATVFWHFARGMAFASTGKVSDAETEYKIVSDAEEATPPDVIFAMPVNNKAKDIMKVAKDVLGAEIALAKKDKAGAIAMFRQAVAIQDTLKYGEPPDWFFPVREPLGAALLMNGNYAEAKKNADMLAEHVGPAVNRNATTTRASSRSSSTLHGRAEAAH